MGLLLAVRTSTYQALKLRVLSALPLAKDAFHIYIGFGCYAAAVLVFRLPLGSGRALIPGFLVSLAMEGLDLRDELRDHGRLLWTDTFRDLVNTNLVPLAIVMLARLRSRLTRRRPPRV